MCTSNTIMIYSQTNQSILAKCSFACYLWFWELSTVWNSEESKTVSYGGW